MIKVAMLLASLFQLLFNSGVIQCATCTVYVWQSGSAKIAENYVVMLHVLDSVQTLK